MGVPLLEFFIRAGLVGLAGLAVLWWLRRQGYHRPVDAKLFTWETFLFRLYQVALGALGGCPGVCRVGLEGSSSPLR